ncbi:Eukaryotic translation initiation factor 3 subunit B like protein [Verticillium longisporum]|uniref:Eukaryotic translation initiation factor 3 subunit B n=1 Tax=Verticillium longisporum TaxID=100787 RepID=A0A8I3AMT2_VERLO|nr:Eukaryotic translation initiation factor 3 subunit B like protein [Verticillium longisporum]
MRAIRLDISDLSRIPSAADLKALYRQIERITRLATAIMAPSYEHLREADLDEDEYDEEEIDISDLREKYEVQLEHGYDTFVVIDGLPAVTEEQKPKLVKFLLKKLNQVGKTREDLIFMPMGEDGLSLRFAFVEYSSAGEAAAAVRGLDMVALDKKHTLRVNKLTDIDRYGREGRVDEDYTPPQIEEFQEKEHLRWWLKDPSGRGRDQFVMYRGESVGVCWNNEKEPAETVVDRQHWTESFVQWSPLGTYLTSPLRSFASLDVPGAEGDDGVAKQRKSPWPAFKWSADDKYVARLTQGSSISVYELPRMGLLDKTTIKIDGVMDFDWAPATVHREGVKNYEQLFCYWTPEIGSNPAKVGLMSIPSKEIVRTLNLFSVSDVKLHWQSDASFLCVKVDRHSKSKKSQATSLEIFRVKEKGVPVEVVDTIKDTVVNFAWEPKGDRFVIITTTEPAGPTAVAPKTSVAFFCPEKNKGPTPGNFKHLRTLDKKNSNSIYWSPRGRFVVVAHYGVTDVEWDPSGRFVATWSSSWKHSMENGYHIYDFKGEQLREEHVEKFKQFLWRPRPATLLTKEEQKQIRKNLREYSKTFEQEDADRGASADREVVEARRRQLDEWLAWRESIEEELVEERAYLGLPEDPIAELLASKVTNPDAEEQIIEEIVEEVIEETEEILQ